MRSDRRTPQPSEERLRHRWLVLALLGAAAGCFDGADAQGLPCREDADCGLTQSCIDGFCGGAPDTSSAGSSSTSAGSSGGSESSSADSDSSGGSTGPLPTCGNGVVDPGESCDPGPEGETPDCDPDCSEVMCGDGVVNATAGEQCDDMTNSPYDGCTRDCHAALFFDEIDPMPGEPMKWEMPMGTVMGGWMPGTSVWSTGVYPDSSGTARLQTVAFEIPMEPPPTGTHYELRIRHHYRFDNSEQENEPLVCPLPSYSDGAMIFIRPFGMAGGEIFVGPPDDEGVMLDDIAGCEISAQPRNPLLEEWGTHLAFSGLSVSPGMPHETVMVLPPEVASWAGQEVQLVFTVGFDCINCWTDPIPPIGWTIDDVVVAPFPMP